MYLYIKLVDGTEIEEFISSSSQVLVKGKCLYHTGKDGSYQLRDLYQSWPLVNVLNWCVEENKRTPY
jgi:hypothetical protein